MLPGGANVDLPAAEPVTLETPGGQGGGEGGEAAEGGITDDGGASIAPGYKTRYTTPRCKKKETDDICGFLCWVQILFSTDYGVFSLLFDFARLAFKKRFELCYEKTDAVEARRVWFSHSEPSLLELSCSDMRCVFYREGRFVVLVYREWDLG